MISNPKELQTAYPYMFSGKNIGLTFHPGWFNIIVTLFTSIDRVLGDHKDQFYWVQIKEKFGSLRAYPRIGEDVPDHVRDEIYTLIGIAESSTTQTCFVCGKPGTLGGTGWMTTLCPEHREMSGAGNLEIPWFDEEC